MASLSLLGALFGGMFGGMAMQHGRKRVLAIISLPFSLSWILTVFAKSVETMFITAFIGGFCCAIVNLCTQVKCFMSNYWYKINIKYFISIGLYK